MRKRGEVWEVEHVRKGALTIRLEEDVTEDQEWFNAELLTGKPSYVSNEARIGFKSLDTPCKGDIMSHRQSLIRWLKKID